MAALVNWESSLFASHSFKYLALSCSDCSALASSRLIVALFLLIDSATILTTSSTFWTVFDSTKTSVSCVSFLMRLFESEWNQLTLHWMTYLSNGPCSCVSFVVAVKSTSYHQSKSHRKDGFVSIAWWDVILNTYIEHALIVVFNLHIPGDCYEAAAILGADDFGGFSDWILMLIWTSNCWWKTCWGTAVLVVPVVLAYSTFDFAPVRCQKAGYAILEVRVRSNQIMDVTKWGLFYFVDESQVLNCVPHCIYSSLGLVRNWNVVVDLAGHVARWIEVHSVVHLLCRNIVITSPLKRAYLYTCDNQNYTPIKAGIPNWSNLHPLLLELSPQIFTPGVTLNLHTLLT